MSTTTALGKRSDCVRKVVMNDMNIKMMNNRTNREPYNYNLYEYYKRLNPKTPIVLFKTFLNP